MSFFDSSCINVLSQRSIKRVKRLQDRNSAPIVFRPKVDVKRNFVSDGEALAETLFEVSDVADNVVDLRSDDDLQPPRPEIDDPREVREARQLDGFHDIDPQCREQVSTRPSTCYPFGNPQYLKKYLTFFLFYIVKIHRNGGFKA